MSVTMGTQSADTIEIEIVDMTMIDDMDMTTATGISAIASMLVSREFVSEAQAEQVHQVVPRQALAHAQGISAG